MNFLNRLKYYLIGVGIGIMVVLAIFKDRKLTNWTPQNQVIKDINEKELIYSEFIQCQFECVGMENNDTIIALLSDSDVDFKHSEVKDHDARNYILNSENHPVEQIELLITRDQVEIKKLKISGANCICD